MSVHTYRLKGSSLVEVLIALAITSFCAALASAIYLNIQKSSLPFFKVKAMEIAGSYMSETLEKRNFSEEEYTVEEFMVRRKIEPAALFPDCYLVRIMVFDMSRKKIAELESLVKPY